MKSVSTMTNRPRVVMATMNDRFLPGVPGPEIETVFAAAPGNEIESGKFDSPESSACLAANGFGFFLRRAADLPPLPGCGDERWPARSLMLEAEVRFPWSGGRHPVLDCLVTTPSAFIGIESKRFEPFRGRPKSAWSNAYWRPVWGKCMRGYESMRDGLHGEPGRYEHLDAAQLVKHAFGLRTAVRKRPEFRALAPILYYVYAEPDSWPNSETPVDEGAKARHREEIERFAAAVVDDEVAFVSCSWRRLLETWTRHENGRIRAHATAVAARFAP